jgi:hypothetical protein
MLFFCGVVNTPVLRAICSLQIPLFLYGDATGDGWRFTFSYIYIFLYLVQVLFPRTTSNVLWMPMPRHREDPKKRSRCKL